jgi:ring-1,2-phenylacetyl-CoA epoxidase subunit PaaB
MEPRREWTVFRQDKAGGYHAHCGEVSANDAESAKHAAMEQYADDEPHSLWVVRSQYIGEITADQVKFGGTTDKSYRFAQTYNVTPAAAEVEESENEQVEAERKRGEA